MNIKKILMGGITAVVCTGCLACSVVAADNSIITNGDFEGNAIQENSTDWKFTSSNTWYLLGNASITSEESGNHYVSAGVSDGAGVGQRVDVVGGTTYIITAKVKAKTASELCIQSANESDTYPGSSNCKLTSTSIPASDTWTDISFEYTANTNQKQVLVYVWASNGSSICMDDVTMAAKTQAYETDKISPDADEGETKDAVGFTYTLTKSANSAVWYVNNGSQKAAVEMNSLNITLEDNSSAVIGLIIKDIPSNVDIDALSATIEIN